MRSSRYFCNALRSKYVFPVRSIRDVLLQEFDQKPAVTVSGWVRTVRMHKKVAFIEICDGSGPHTLQAVIPDPAMADDVHTGCSVQIDGRLVRARKGDTVEVNADRITLLGKSDPETYPLHKAKLPIEHLRENGHLRTRSRLFSSLWRLRSAATGGLHDFFKSCQFIQVNIPILTAHDCEGGGEVFRVFSSESVKALDRVAESVSVKTADPSNEEPQNMIRRSSVQEFFDAPAHLTVSGQLHLELLTSGLSRAYTLSPAFRAEKSLSARHLAEFWMLEAEAAFLTSIDQLQDLIEACVRHTAEYVLETATEELGCIDSSRRKYLENIIISKPFSRVSYTEAVDILRSAKGKKWEFFPEWGLPLQSEHERYLADVHFGNPVFVFRYPKTIKPFYMLGSNFLETFGETVECTDLLVPGVGELVGGSLREHRFDVISANIKNAGMCISEYQWYLDLRKYGSVPHGGFGLGLERLIMLLTGVGNVRDVIPFPRFYRHLNF